jgi:hypothetical protein
MSLEGTSQPQCFLIEPSRQANSVIIKTINQKTSVLTKNLQIVQVNAINLYPIPLIYNAASLGINCGLRSGSFVFRRMVDMICVIFIGLGLIFQFLLVLTNVMDTFHIVDTNGLCLPFERDCYLSRTAAYVG